MEKNIEDKVQAIVIPSGGSVEEDLQRAREAINYNGRGLNAPYLISGIGPDINIALGHLAPEERKLDFHPELYEFMIKNTDGIFGLDILAVNSEQNVLNAFGRGAEGTYMLVSYPLHLKRFERIIKEAKEKGEISTNLKVEGLPTDQTFKQTIYGILANIRHARRSNNVLEGKEYETGRNGRFIKRSIKKL